MRYDLSGSVWACVDPGVHHSAIAFFKDSELLHAELTNTFDIPDVAVKARNDYGLLYVLFMEGQQIYAKFSADPADILTLARESGKLLERIPHHHHEIILPRQWKGTVKKDVMTRRIQSKLTLSELGRIMTPKPATLFHNVLDAVGMGLFVAKRLC